MDQQHVVGRQVDADLRRLVAQQTPATGTQRGAALIGNHPVACVTERHLQASVFIRCMAFTIARLPVPGAACWRFIQFTNAHHTVGRQFHVRLADADHIKSGVGRRLCFDAERAFCVKTANTLRRRTVLRRVLPLRNQHQHHQQYRHGAQQGQLLPLRPGHHLRERAAGGELLQHTLALQAFQRWGGRFIYPNRITQQAGTVLQRSQTIIQPQRPAAQHLLSCAHHPEQRQQNHVRRQYRQRDRRRSTQRRNGKHRCKMHGKQSAMS